MKYLALILLLSCNTDSGGVVSDSTVSDARRKTRIIYKDSLVTRILYKDSLVNRPVIRDVPIDVYIPKALLDKIKSGTIKYTIEYK